jgi:Fe(3+) dicitrate transport protein
MNHIPLPIKLVPFFLLVLLSFLTLPVTFAQQATLQGTVFARIDSTRLPAVTVVVQGQGSGTTTNAQGNYQLRLPAGSYQVKVSSIGYKTLQQAVSLQAGQVMNVSFYLDTLTRSLEAVTIMGRQAVGRDMDRLKEVEGTAIYAGKKNEVIQLGNMNANLATNNSRQIYAKVPGLNIIENDAAGIQISIATRGLNPNRTTEFNSRQNGYDISADPIGYPESYYSPPTEALDRIEVVRGAASLQYGTQFGGLLNFVFKKGPANKPIELSSRQTVGSYGLFNSFNSVGGTVGKVNYYTFFHHKQGDGWRQNTGFDANTGFASLIYQANSRLSVATEVTLMKYNMQQPGGLTDVQFHQNPRASYRDRNWFTATWLLPALIVNYELSKNTKLNIRSYALIAQRGTVGNMRQITQPDTAANRTLMMDTYRNFGAEARIIHSYALRTQTSSLLLGVRYYRGKTFRKQGLGSSGSGADFDFIHPNNLENLDFTFPSHNFSFFAENIFRLTSRLSVTPGVRYEVITTHSQGYYQVNNSKEGSKQSSQRSFPLLGIGVGYQVSESTDLYANYSQNYSPINYSDILIDNPSLKVDADLKDVTGYNADLGYRGKVKDILNFDASVFYLSYNNRIGLLTQRDNDFNTYQYRTNVADSHNYGAEVFAEVAILPILKVRTNQLSLSVYGSAAYLNATYIHTPQKSILHKKVEYAPDWIIRGGMSGKVKGISATIQYSSVSQQFTDATNATSSPDGISGVILAYSVWDFSLNYSYKKFQAGAGINNLLDHRYFTRRTSGFPGPGIIPADARSGYISLGVRI